MPEPGTSDYWDAVGREWAGYQRDRPWRDYCDRRNTRLLSGWLADGSGGRMLKTDLFDEAVAAGLYPCLSGLADKVTGIDVSPEVVRAASQQYAALETHCADVRELPFEDGAFDTVVSLSTLDHFPAIADIGKALVELHRVLKEGGVLVLTLDNGTHPGVRLRNLLPHGLLHRAGLVPYRTGSTCGGQRLVRMVEDAGFAVEEFSYHEHCPRWPAVQLGRHWPREALEAYHRWLSGWERLGRCPTAPFTGHYVALRARKGAS